MFNERKAAQMAAYFLRRQHGRMSILKLMKLLYLTERESLKLYSLPMCGDRLVSMDHGPVLSNTLNLANSVSIDSVDGSWESWIAPRMGREILLANPECGDEDFDELSKADLKALERVWIDFGDYHPIRIRNHTHKLEEWEDPKGTSLPIDYSRIFEALGHSEQEAAELALNVEIQQMVADKIQAL